MSSPPARSPRHPPIVRVAHWCGALAIGLMAASGLRILNASPEFARRGDAPWALWPWEGTPAPAWLTLGGWLGGARHWHFGAMWLFAFAGVLYVGHLARHGRWRTIVPLRGDWRDGVAMARFYLRLDAHHPPQGKHNALQKQTYTVMVACGVVSLTSGLAIWKPVTLGWLAALYGGYTWARWWHFVAMLVLVTLAVVHVAMVLLVDPYSLRAMTTGGYDEARWSPAARDARPFQHWGPRPTVADAPAADAALPPAPLRSPTGMEAP